MSESELPQPITREEFEAGVEFYHSPKLGKFDDMDLYNKKMGYIESKNHYYCSIQSIDEYGFLCIIHLFGQPNEFKVLFKNCFKLQNQ